LPTPSRASEAPLAPSLKQLLSGSDVGTQSFSLRFCRYSSQERSVCASATGRGILEIDKAHLVTKLPFSSKPRLLQQILNFLDFSEYQCIQSHSRNVPKRNNRDALVNASCHNEGLNCYGIATRFTSVKTRTYRRKIINNSVTGSEFDQYQVFDATRARHAKLNLHLEHGRPRQSAHAATHDAQNACQNWQMTAKGNKKQFNV
jgi:hypothetical protein